MTIQRFETGPRMSQAVVHGDTVYLAGVVANKTAGESVTKQTQEILAIIDGHLSKAGSDTVAMGVVVALLEAKLRVPDDVSVIGYNDLPIAQYFQRPLTTIRQDTYQAGSLLVEKLFQ